MAKKPLLPYDTRLKNKKVCMNLREFIESRRFKKYEFAKAVGISTSALSNYLMGRRTPTLDIALRISHFTKGRVSLNDLIKK